MSPSSPRLALTGAFLTLALFLVFAYFPLSHVTVPTAHAEPLAPASYVVTSTASVAEMVNLTRTAELGDGRTLHTATLLPDGKVLIVGGLPDAISNTAKLFDPAFHFVPGSTISSTGQPVSGRIGHSATLLNNGKVLVVGGHRNPGSAELYDPATGSFVPTGSLTAPRWAHSATLLPNGKVLIVGGLKPSSAAATDGSDYVTSAELYDPATGNFTPTGAPAEPRRTEHTATLLPDGTVLITGGYVKTGGEEYSLGSAEIYNPSTGTFTNTVSLMRYGRASHTATLLSDGRVLLAGGINPINGTNPHRSEYYNPSTGIFSDGYDLPNSHYGHTATRLTDGKVALVGGCRNPYPNYAPASGQVDFFNPTAGINGTGATSNVGRMSGLRCRHTATLLNNGTLLFTGGGTAYTALASVLPANTFSASVTLPAQYVNSRTIEVSARGTTSGAPLQALNLPESCCQPPSNGWVAATSNQAVTWTRTFMFEGENVVRLWARDANSQRVMVAQVRVFVDTGRPGLPSMSSLPVTSPNPVTLNWAPGYDGYPSSGVESYDVEVKEGANNWTPLLTRTTARSTTFTGTPGLTYYFRVRAYDRAGNLSAWPDTYNSYTRIQNAFTGSISAPSGWLTNPNVSVTFSGRSAGDNSGTPVNGASLSNNSSTWGPWITTSPGVSQTVIWNVGADGANKSIFLRLRDVRGDMAVAASATIKLDTVVPTSSMTALPATSEAAIPLAWSGTDATSGIAGYDVQVRQGTSGQWATILSGTTALDTVYNGARGHTYYFRVRATDNAGHVEAWPSTYDTMTRVRNQFTGAVDAPNGWLTTATGPVSFSGNSVGDPVTAAALSNDGTTWGAWINVTPGVTQTVTWNFGGDGASKTVHLRLRDSSGEVANVATDNVKVDTVAPLSTMTALNATSPGTVQLAWSGSDATSGIASYDVEFRQGTAGPWESVLAATTATTANFTGSNNNLYYFRVRARDVAGHVEAWPGTYDTYTKVDTEGPTGSVTINGGALATTGRGILLDLPATDEISTVAQMRLRANNEPWGAWQPYAADVAYTLPGTDELKTMFVQFRDEHGNVSAQATDTIQLDQAAGTSDDLVTINNGGLWTSSTSVTLKISAPTKTVEMQISNDGGFAGAAWQPFDTRPTWQLVSYGSYAIPRTVYVRTRDIDGTIRRARSDDIIYDPVPPTGNATIHSVDESHIQVSLRATDPDNLSGVAAMRVALAGDFARAEWEPFAESKQIALGNLSPDDVQLVVQFRDGAGNVSEPICVTSGGSTCAAGQQTFLWLPFVQRR